MFTIVGSSFCPNVFYGPLDSAIVSSSTVTSSSTTVANGGTNTSSADEGNSQHDPNTSESSNLSAESIAKPVAAVPKKISDPRCVVAVGDKKGVISLWGTHTHRPILTISSLFAGAVTDISWAHSHPRNPRQFQILGMASMDGTVALVDLTGDIGSAMNNSELDQHFLALYSLSRKDLSVRKPFTAIPLAAMYRNARNNPVKTNHIISSRMNTSMPPPQRQPPKIAPNSSAAAVTSSAPTQNQVVIVNGKKRIRPMLIQSGVNGSSSTAVNNLAEEVRGETVQRGDTLDFSGFDPSDDYQYQSFHDRTSTAQATNGSVKRFKATNQGADRNISYNFAVTNSMDKFLSFHHSTGKVVTTLPSLRQQHSASNNASTKKIVIDKVVTTQLHVLRLRKSRPIEISLDNFERIMKTAPSKKPVTVDSIDELVEDAVKSLRCKLHRHQNSWTLSCSRASKPKSLRNLSHSGGHFSTVSLLRSGSSINSKTEEGLWSTVLVGEVTCISGCVNASVPIDADNSSSASTNGLPSSDAVVMNELNDIVAMYRGKANDMISTSNTLQTLTGTVEGVVVVGCSDGSIYLLDLSSGLRLGAPVVIGMPVAYLDTSLVVDKNRSIQEHYFASLGSSSTSSSQTLSTSVRLLACSATGDLYAWDYGPNRQLVAQLKTTVRPVLDCMKFSSEHEFWHVHLESDRNSATNSSVVSNSESIKSVYVEDCQLTEYGSVLVKCSASHTGCGGIWRSYIYDIEGDVWTKIADNNHKLSR